MKEIFIFDRDYLGESGIHIHKKQGDTSYVAHRHDYYEIIYYKNCGGACIVNGTEYPITDNCLFLLTPKDFHRIDAINTVNSSSVIISFSEKVADSELISALGLLAKVVYNPTKRMENAIDGLCACYSDGGKYKEKKLYHLLSALLCDVIENAEDVNDENPYLNQYVRRAMTLVLTDTAKYSTLTAVADACKVSAPYFSDLFKRETGKSFSAWICSVKIDRAKRLLEETDKSILEVCYDCGYNTPSQFIKMFKREAGQVPSEYRKSRKNLK